jgi:replicative DNA helicase
MNVELTDLILTNMVKSPDFLQKTAPFLKAEYFKKSHKVLFEIIDNYVNDYSAGPTPSALYVELEKREGIPQQLVDDARTLIGRIDNATIEENQAWLLDQTEEFCQDQAIYQALLTSINITEGNSKEAKGLSKGAIPKLFQDALSVSFDTNIGHNFFQDAAARYDKYHTKSEKIPFDLEYFNKITNGGFEKKTLNIIAAGTGVGKSLGMCSMAAANLREGRNVLYITMEMAEEKIAERIDANLLDININELTLLPRDDFIEKVERLHSKTVGNLIIKEYPTTQAGAAHFRHLLIELKQKNNFVPDVIYIDYINLCMSARLKFTGVNSYNYIKSVAEELRGLAVEFNVPIWSATQLNRTGYADSDAGLEHTSDSFGLPFTADFMVIFIQTEEMERLGQVLVKQTTKNRYGDPGKWKRFVIGMDKTRQRLYNVEQSAQDAIHHDDNDSAVFDKSGAGERIAGEGRKFNKSAFENFK